MELNSEFDLTVVIPVYKVDDYIDECLESVLNQSYSAFNLILTDDGSPCNDSMVCDKIAAEDSRTIVIHKKNGGLSSARNFGIDLTSTKYISFIDSDDYIDKDFISEMLGSIKKYDCDISVCNITTFDECGNIDDNYFKPYDSLHIATEMDIYDSLIEPSAWNKIYKRSIFDDIRYPEGKLFEDLFIYHYVLDKVAREAYVGKNLYFYRIRNNSIMRSPYTIASTDIIDGYYDRACFYENKNLHGFADDAYLWVYSRIADAFSCLDANEEKNRLRLKELKKLYNGIFKRIFINGKFSAKQKLRFLMLFISPKLHELMYSK